jgi:hypothetical protein
MRFMVFVPASKESEEGKLPSRDLVEKMMKFNEEMVKAGVLLAGEGLQPTSKGARITYDDGKIKVTDGPFTESKELIAGYWVIQVKSKEDAIAWMSRAPFGGGVSLELRQIFEPTDFSSVDPSGELIAKDFSLRSQSAQQKG